MNFANTSRPAWTLTDSERLYAIQRWGMGFYAVNEQGHMVVKPQRDSGRVIDLAQVVEKLHRRDIGCPLIVRCSEILETRVQDIAKAFEAAREEHDYQADYRCIYPIKVNQQRHVVQTIHDAGRPHGFGLEAGSKAELLAVLGTVTDGDTPVICNGFKDEDYLTAAMGAASAGLDVTLVIEWLDGVDEAIAVAQSLGVQPKLGLRVRLAAQVTSRWEDCSGRHAKFGMSQTEVAEAIRRLREADMLDSLQLLHFHAGSQMSELTGFAKAVEQLAELYCHLRTEGVPLNTLDVGGGLGIDYAGSAASSDYSIDYTEQDYAHTVVSRIADVCNQTNEAHPTILSESGRALTAPHSLTIFNVLGKANHSDDLATYFINASVFQSLPDGWAIDQRFPILPIHRLDTPPDLRCTLADITCDSDGKIDHFVSQEGIVASLPVHELVPDQPYYLAAFLTGAYQEILGDLHNLFGDETIVHVRAGETPEQPVIERIIRGDPIAEILTYLDYDPNTLTEQFCANIGKAVEQNHINSKQAKAIIDRYRGCMQNSTYLR